MPSTATITAFYSFTANTKARASQVNGNFDLFRGHIIPIDPNTQTAISNTYDLGSTEYRWREGYFRSINLITNTTTGNALTIEGNTATATPGFFFKISGTAAGRISKYPGYTTAADYGGIALSANINTSMNLSNGTDATLTQSAISLNTDGRPVDLDLITSPATTTGYVQIIGSGTSAYLSYTVKFFVDNSVSGAYQYNLGGFTATAYNASSRIIQIPFNFRHRAFLASGAHTFYATFQTNLGATCSVQFLCGALTAVEI